MSKIFNPLYDSLSAESVSSLTNDVQGVCPKCHKAFDTGTVDNDTVYYCDTCRVCQPIQQ